MSNSVGSTLINHFIPLQYQIKENSSAGDIKQAFINWAKGDPKSYSENIAKIKRIADHIVTYEGFSIGLDDIAPMKELRKPFLDNYQKQLDKATTEKEKKDILAGALLEGSKLSLRGTGSLVDMVHTGTKGNAAQLMKNILTPVTARDADTTPYPYLIHNSFSEGLTPGEYWVASIEARNATVEGKTATAEPGDLGKQMFNALNTMVISARDCGTQNGIFMKTDEHQILDRYLAKDIPGVAKRNTLMTEQIANILKKKNIPEVMVRSPMSCEARNGVCQLCYGLNSAGRHHEIGANVGTIAAQSLSEPLTQMKLSTKHGVVLSGRAVEDTGMKGVKKLLSKPEVFPNKSALAQIDGKVDKIIQAPQGGHYVYIQGIEHYIPIHNTVIVKSGDRVARGDAISDGLKDPREFTMLRGLGSGRSYMTQALYNAFNPLDEKTGKRTGIDIDKRHLEVLAKKDLNHVVIDEHNDTFSRGSIVEYNQLKEHMMKNTKEVFTKDSLGDYLGKEYMHYTVGTQITPNIMETLIKRGFNKVIITGNPVKFTPFVTNIRAVPMLKANFLGKLSHQELKSAIIQAGRLGEEAELVGYDPIPAYIHGITFGEAEDGKY